MTTALPRYSVYLRLLRISLAVGAVYDLVLAVLLALAPDLLERWFGIPLPGEDFYIWLIALFLFILAAVYALAAYDPASYYGNVLVAIGARFAASLVLVAGAQRGDIPGLYPLAAGDFAFALVHAVFWWPVRR